MVQTIQGLKLFQEPDADFPLFSPPDWKPKQHKKLPGQPKRVEVLPTADMSAQLPLLSADLKFRKPILPAAAWRPNPRTVPPPDFEAMQHEARQNLRDVEMPKKRPPKAAGRHVAKQQALERTTRFREGANNTAKQQMREYDEQRIAGSSAAGKRAIKKKRQRRALGSKAAKRHRKAAKRVASGGGLMRNPYFDNLLISSDNVMPPDADNEPDLTKIVPAFSEAAAAAVAPIRARGVRIAKQTNVV